MKVVKIPYLGKSECEKLIFDEYVCRIAFKGDKYPYIAPFIYVCDGEYLYFLSTNYGKKIQYFRENPCVAVEIEKKSPDLSEYKFVVLSVAW